MRIIQSPPLVPVGTRRDFFCERSGRLTLTAQKAMELDLACSSESCPALSSSQATDPPALGWNPQTFLPRTTAFNAVGEERQRIGMRLCRSLFPGDDFPRQNQAGEHFDL